MRSIQALGLAVLLAGCATTQKTEGEGEGEGEGAVTGAVTEKIGPVAIEAKSGSSLSGDVSLNPVEGGVEVELSVTGAPPGLHGVHIHEVGDCSAEDASSAGGHFNPRGHQHGLPGSEETHLGDLGNLEVGEDGSGTLRFTANGATLEPANELSFRGRALIVHEKEDTGGQPTGDAGGRIGCAVLGG